MESFNRAAIQGSRKNVTFSNVEASGAASIGPRSKDRGKLLGHRGGPGCGAASIGPRSKDRGKTRGRGALRRWITCFNRAAIQGSRKRAISLICGGYFASFNRAAIQGSRKNRHFPGVRPLAVASIGPRSKDRGKQFPCCTPNGAKSLQ